LKTKIFSIPRLSMTLYRQTAKQTKYFRTNLYPTLFDEWLIERESGLLSSKKPTKTSRKFYDKKFDALKDYGMILSSIADKGYRRFTERAS